jgi:hypothetical protein
MEARTIYCNFMGRKWTIEVKADFTLSKEYPEDTKFILTTDSKETKIYLTIIKPSLDENDKKEIKNNLFTYLVFDRAILSEFNTYVEIYKDVKKLLGGDTKEMKNIIDSDFYFFIRENEDEILIDLEKIYKEIIDFVETI